MHVQVWPVVAQLGLAAQATGAHPRTRRQVAQFCSRFVRDQAVAHVFPLADGRKRQPGRRLDRKSTRLNSNHSQISYAVFCLKKKKKLKPPGHYITQHASLEAHKELAAQGVISTTKEVLRPLGRPSNTDLQHRHLRANARSP